jgi:type IV pilus assembly protein PilB
MQTQNVTTTKGIEDVLFEKKLITQDQLSAIKFEHVNTGKSIESIIKERGFVSTNEFVKAMADVYHLEYADLTKVKIEPELLELIPSALAKKYSVVPYSLDGNILKVAMADPLDLQTIEFVERKTGHTVVPAISTQKEIEHVLEEQQGKAIGAEISAALEEISQTTLKIDENNKTIDDQATLRDAPIARIVEMILQTAVKTGASDIHLEPMETETRLRYRIDGILEEKRRIPKEMHDSIIARIKILSNMKIDEKRIPQDGRFRVNSGNKSTDLRVSSLPTVFGEKIVIRLLKEEGAVFTFKDLGLRGLALKRFEEAIIKPTGMILVTGPTGSGKTVTLASALSKLNTVRVNIVTIEDPVEIRVQGVNQVQVNPQAGLTFAAGLRSFLRQDPNVVMVGEIRDSETAELAVHAALTGHLVLSTLHTNSASGAIPRLLDMKMESFLLASTVNAVLAQRLVRKICPDCKEAYQPPEEIMDEVHKVLGTIENSHILMNRDKEIADTVNKMKSGKVELFHGKGCDKCGNSGYKGRVGIFEVLIMSNAIGLLTMESKPDSEIARVAIEEGMLTLVQDGYLKALEGLTTLEEVLRVAKG